MPIIDLESKIQTNSSNTLFENRTLQTHSTPYASALSKLDQLISYEKSAQPREISKLQGMRELLAQLHHPERKFRIIHVAGTNGKGLTSAMIAAMIRKAGYCDGFYNSPHVCSIRERIQIGGDWLTQAEFSVCVEQVLKVKEQITLPLSYFDVLTAVALVAFARGGVSWAVLETGLGGGADSTNAVMEKACCVCTPINYDHQEVLGSTLWEIAQEKLAILRPQVPFVLARQMLEIDVQSVAFLKQQQAIVIRPPENDWTDLKSKNDLRKIKEIGLFSRHSRPKLLCAELALTTLNALQKELKITQEWLQTNAAEILQTSLPARLESFQNLHWEAEKIIFPQILLDGGHNAQALNGLNQYLKESQCSNYLLIFGIAKDKISLETYSPIQELLQNASEIIYTKFQSLRCSTKADLAQLFNSQSDSLNNFKVSESENISASLHLASTKKASLIVISGSFYLAGEFYHLFRLKDCI